jgi:hypothetical protein
MVSCEVVAITHSSPIAYAPMRKVLKAVPHGDQIRIPSYLPPFLIARFFLEMPIYGPHDWPFVAEKWGFERARHVD